MPFSFPERWRDTDHQPNPLTEALEARKKSGLPILDLTISNPTQCDLGTPSDWTQLLADAEALRYDPHPQGLLKTREAIAQYYADRGQEISFEDLFITAGTSEAYAHLFKLLCNRGDTVLVPAPSYPLLETLASLEDIELRPYALIPGKIDAEGNVPWHLDRKSLEASLSEKTRAICVVQPNNPTGSILSADDAEYLGRLANEHGLALIVDEVFADYCLVGPVGAGLPRPYRPTAPIPIQSHQSLVFTLNGLSKILGLPQLKVAWIHVDGNSNLAVRAKGHLEWICDAYLSVNTASQIATPELLRRRSEFQNPIRARIAENLETLRDVAKTNLQLEPLWPQGGWCIPVRCHGVEDDETFALTLIKEHGVLTHPGYFFDFTDENILVLSLLTPPEIFRDGLRILGEEIRL